MKINILELFSGIGGFSLGLKNAGFEFDKHYFSEIDKHAIANYRYNFPNSHYVGSVTDVRGCDIEHPNIITFGSPCQDFSLAGKRLGMEGNRSSLVTEAIRLITETRPDVFIWENVKGAFSSNNSNDFWAIIQAFANIGGYRLEWQLLNTSWVLPQNRERIYLIGHLAERSKPGVFPITTNNTGIDEGSINSSIVRTLTAGGHSGGLHSSMTLVKSLQGNDFTNTIRSGGRCSLTQKHSWDMIKTKAHGFAKAANKEVCPTIKANSFEHNNHVVSGTWRTQKDGKVFRETSGKNCPTIPARAREDGSGQVVVKAILTPNRLEKRQNGRRLKEDGEPAFTLSCQDQHGVMIDEAIRRLTEIECERLQGFPDDWTKFGNYIDKSNNIITKEIPKTQRYKMCGNAVTSEIVKMIGLKLITSMQCQK